MAHREIQLPGGFRVRVRVSVRVRVRVGVSVMHPNLAGRPTYQICKGWYQAQRVSANRQGIECSPKSLLGSGLRLGKIIIKIKIKFKFKKLMYIT